MAPLRRLSAPCLLVLCLLLAVVLASGDGEVKDGPCYRTAIGVPKWCGGEFIQALFSNYKFKVSDKCCVLLACVEERSCVPELGRVCPPPATGPVLPHECPPK